MKYTKEQAREFYRKRKAEYLEALKTQKVPEGFICFNAFTKRQYSPNNHSYIAFQQGEPGAYAGFIDWKKHGYKVNKGAKGIHIMQPIIKEVTNEKDETEKEMVNVSWITIFHHSQVSLQ